MSSIPGDANEYRLGTIFLRNFYTALDFDTDMIILGLNKNSAKYDTAYIAGHADDPNR